MRFTDGLWMRRSGVSIHNTRQLWEYWVSDREIHAFVLCHCVEEADDYTAGTALEIVFSAPIENAICVDVTHYRGKKVKAPAFSLKTSQPAVQIAETSEQIVMQNGRMKLVIQKGKSFAFDFFYDGRYLTGSQNGSLAYIADVDYEADKFDDVNHRTSRKPYMQETYLRERLNLGIGETIYGLGEHFMPLVRNGQTLDVWNRDGSSNCDQGYKCIPFYLSSFGYGVLVNTTDYIKFEFGTESVRHVQFSVEDERLSYILLGGKDLKAVLSQYTEMTGRTPVPPTWSFGLWLSTSWIPNSTEETALAAIDQMQARGIPLSVYHFDARWMEDFHDCDFVWSRRFGNARHMIEQIHRRGVKVCVWINPYVSQISRLFEEGRENGYFLKRPDGSVWQTDMWMCGTAIVDFTNPEAVRWYTSRLEEILDMGVDCVKTDFGERLPTDVVYHDGSDPRKMHNYYAYLYNKAIYELLVRKKGEHEACVFARAATVGTQQFPINWGGDNQASYVSMAESLRGGLSFCQSGFGFWCHDISGFEDTATPDLYKRWAAFGMLCTHSRLHGHTSLRMPWCFDEESCDVLAHFTKLKCRLMPYIYSGAVKVQTEGIPEMRAMVLEYPDDPTCLYLDRQYMLGDSLLVAPVFNEEGKTAFYLPGDGLWTDFQTGETLEGSRWHTKQYDYFGLPLMVRPNTLLPVGPVDSRVEYDYTQSVTLELFQLEDGRTAKTVLYRSGETQGITVSAVRKGKQLTFTWDGELAGCKFLLRGVKACSSVGEVSAGVKQEVLLIPEQGARSLTYTLE